MVKKSNVGKIILNYFKDTEQLKIEVFGWKVGEERTILRVIEIASKYIKSPQFQKTIIDAIHKQNKLFQKMDKMTKQ